MRRAGEQQAACQPLALMRALGLIELKSAAPGMARSTLIGFDQVRISFPAPSLLMPVSASLRSNALDPKGSVLQLRRLAGRRGRERERMRSRVSRSNPLGCIPGTWFTSDTGDMVYSFSGIGIRWCGWFDPPLILIKSAGLFMNLTSSRA